MFVQKSVSTPTLFLTFLWCCFTTEAQIHHQSKRSRRQQGRIFNVTNSSDMKEDGDGVPIRQWRNELKLTTQKNTEEDEQQEYYDGSIRFLDDYYAKNRKDTNTMTAFGNNTNNSSSDVYDVVIVGAGWAGISAAITLESEGITNYVVLEAKENIGGRSHTIYEEWENEDIPIDLGSMWIHGGSSNPIKRLADEFNIPNAYFSNLEKVYKPANGGPFTDQELTDYYNRLYTYGFYSYQRDRQESTNYDERLQQTANKYFKLLSEPLDIAVLNYFLYHYIETAYGGALSQQSLWWWNSYYSFGGGDHFMYEGYTNLVDVVAAPIVGKILKGKVVTDVVYKTKNVKVSCKNDESYLTKKVIMTVPVGVLKSQSINFQPNLPWKTRRSIRRIGMGNTLNKIFMFWNNDDVFWPRTTEILGEAVHRNDNFLFFNAQTYNGNKPLLFAFFVGNGAKELEVKYGNSDESRYNQEISDLAMKSLRNMFGDDIPSPEKVVVTKWNVDPFAMGTYSFNKFKMGKADRRLLSRPIRKRLYFAGEATSVQSYGTTHGAYSSGRGAAMKVKKHLRREREV